jgi:hypothetical protein
VEADDKLFRADADELRLASHPLPVRSRSAPPRQRVLAATRAPLRPAPSHRSHARDGPPRGSTPSPHDPVLKRDVKATADRVPRPRQPRAGSPRQAARIS